MIISESQFFVQTIRVESQICDNFLHCPICESLVRLFNVHPPFLESIWRPSPHFLEVIRRTAILEP